MSNINKTTQTINSHFPRYMPQNWTQRIYSRLFLVKSQSQKKHSV